MNARYNKIKYNDIANASGISVSVFLQGCDFHCDGCFNKETWDFNYGKEFNQSTIDEIIKALSPNHINGLTILGGEPFEEENLSGADILLFSILLKFFSFHLLLLFYHSKLPLLNYILTIRLSYISYILFIANPDADKFIIISMKRCNFSIKIF